MRAEGLLDRSAIAALVPHHGAMCLLDAVEAWDDRAITCRVRSHLEPANPLRRAGRLATICGLECGFQAAALHGALRAGGACQKAGWLAALRRVALHVPFLDDPSFGLLRVDARAELAEAAGLVYAIRLAAEDGRALAEARATIVLPP